VYNRLFVPGDDFVTASNPEALWIWGTFVVWFQDRDRLVYALRRHEGWSEFRVIELTPTIGVGDAKLQVRDLLEEEFRSAY
jgi:hypothetical protein